MKGFSLVELVPSELSHLYGEAVRITRRDGSSVIIPWSEWCEMLKENNT